MWLPWLPFARWYHPSCKMRDEQPATDRHKSIIPNVFISPFAYITRLAYHEYMRQCPSIPNQLFKAQSSAYLLIQ